ncbi:unnamed protein product [Leptidea sinapis]|uniref:Uncharacterized protein n=1 Tax=Leptidea sinapis TaxID=189913 RepID=A0A5E4Q2T9_9NEOP|nr:unnamed protein product [Leptidea sinapis]
MFLLLCVVATARAGGLYGASYAAAPVATYAAGPALSYAAGPALSYATGPAVSYAANYAAPVTTYAAAPVIKSYAAPAVYSAPVAYSSPVVKSLAYTAPVVKTVAPAVSSVSSYSTHTSHGTPVVAKALAPVSYAASPVAYSAPSVAYSAPLTYAAHAAPVATYAAHAAPVATYAAHAAPVATYAAHAAPVATYAAQVAPIATYAAPLVKSAVTYSAAPAVSHVSYSGLSGNYGCYCTVYKSISCRSKNIRTSTIKHVHQGPCLPLRRGYRFRWQLIACSASDLQRACVFNLLLFTHCSWISNHLRCCTSCRQDHCILKPSIFLLITNRSQDLRRASSCCLLTNLPRPCIYIPRRPRSCY